MYDIIGDIHGYSDELEILLQKMGYEKPSGIYRHPEKRKVAFVGDFIDRGPKIRETLHLVKDMCDAGHAIAIMGNHEYNAICFHTPLVEKEGFFRVHGSKEIEQHIETLDQFKHYPKEWTYFLDWFKTLPIYFENDDFRMVHACWDDAHINWLNLNYKGITNEFLSLAAIEDSEVYKVVEETLKGKESRLPDGLSFKDKDGVERYDCRIKWWADDNNRKSFGQMMMECPEEIAKKDIPVSTKFYSYKSNKPVFFGHYWLRGTPVLENPNAVCLDYSVAKGGRLVSCRLGKDNGVVTRQFIY